MRRRAFLAVVGGVAIAGCASDDTEEIDDTTDSDDDNPENENEDETEEETEASGESNVEIVDHELVIEEGQYSTDAYVEVLVENTGNAPSGNIELTTDWYDADGNYLDNDRSWLVSLDAGETWEAHIHSLGSNSEDVDDYEIEGEFAERSGEEPEHLEPDDLELTVGDNEAVVSGTIENTDDAEEGYVAAVAKFYDENDVVLGDDYTNVTDLAAGESWAFDVTWRGRDRVSRVDDFELLVANTT